MKPRTWLACLQIVVVYIYILLWINKARANDQRVWWIALLINNKQLEHWVARGTGTPKDRDDVNRRDVCECDGWVCVLEVIGVPSIFKLVRKAASLARVLPTFAFRTWSKFIFIRIKKRRKPKVKLVTLQLCEVKKSRSSFYEKVPVGRLVTVIHVREVHRVLGQGDIRFLFCSVFGPVNRRENWKTWERCVENLDYQW